MIKRLQRPKNVRGISIGNLNTQIFDPQVYDPNPIIIIERSRMGSILLQEVNEMREDKSSLH